MGSARHTARRSAGRTPGDRQRRVEPGPRSRAERRKGSSFSSSSYPSAGSPDTIARATKPVPPVSQMWAVSPASMRLLYWRTHPLDPGSSRTAPHVGALRVALEDPRAGRASPRLDWSRCRHDDAPVARRPSQPSGVQATIIPPGAPPGVRSERGLEAPACAVAGLPSRRGEATRVHRHVRLVRESAAPGHIRGPGAPCDDPVAICRRPIMSGLLE